MGAKMDVVQPMTPEYSGIKEVITAEQSWVKP